MSSYIGVEEISNEIGNPSDLSAYIEALVKNKSRLSLSWVDISNIVEDQFGFVRGRDYYRRNYSDLLDDDGSQSSETLDEKMLQLKKLRVKISDERTQNNAYIRRLSREETIKEIAVEASKSIAEKKSLLRDPISADLVKVKNSKYEGILCLSDWHYGIEIDSFLNQFNTDIARERVSNLCDKVIRICKETGIRVVHVLNLGDLICGRIHLTLRLQSRIDVITQTIEVSEILCEFLTDMINEGIEVHYYDCLDNHSRVEPNTESSLDLESLSRIIPWYVRSRMKLTDMVTVHDNVYGESIISFESMGHKCLGVHGHNDKPHAALDAISLLTHNSYDLLCIAHYHHFSADEKNESVIVGNGTLMGTDQYAEKKRLSSRPSQNFIVVSEENVVEDIRRILV